MKSRYSLGRREARYHDLSRCESTTKLVMYNIQNDCIISLRRCEEIDVKLGALSLLLICGKEN
jgi:hypothetical protein